MEPYIAQIELQTAIALDKADWILRGLIFLTPDTYDDEPKRALLTAFGSLVIEHFRSIIELCRDKQGVGSALALFRPLLDASVRGQWLFSCADDFQREAFMKNEFDFAKERLGFKALALAVDAKTPEGNLFTDFLEYYSDLCDWTHCGHNAVAMRLSPEGIQPSYSEARIRLLLFKAARVTVLHFCAAQNLLGNGERVDALTFLLAVSDD